MTEHLHSIFLKAYDRKYRFIPVEIKVLVGIGLFVAILLLDFPAWQQPEMALLFAGIVAFFL
ncbi:MAG TPA: hypothetical protein VJ044_12660, partial [Candidatus Hodarchaeales archaeon]|nr:hypothetical protein [Candidatus Hodarchaeales archaeon]